MTGEKARDAPRNLHGDLTFCSFLSRCHRAVTPDILFEVDTRCDSRVSAGQSGVSGVDLDIGVFQICGTTREVPFDFQVETASS